MRFCGHSVPISGEPKKLARIICARSLLDAPRRLVTPFGQFPRISPAAIAQNLHQGAAEVGIAGLPFRVEKLIEPRQEVLVQLFPFPERCGKCNRSSQACCALIPSPVRLRRQFVVGVDGHACGSVLAGKHPHQISTTGSELGIFHMRIELP